MAATCDVQVSRATMSTINGRNELTGALKDGRPTCERTDPAQLITLSWTTDSFGDRFGGWFFEFTNDQGESEILSANED